MSVRVGEWCLLLLLLLERGVIKVGTRVWLEGEGKGMGRGIGRRRYSWR